MFFVANKSYSQDECDSLACYKYADTTSFEILGPANETEANGLSTNYMISCNMLCEIESLRSVSSDITVDLNGYKVLIFKRETALISKEE